MRFIALILLLPTLLGAQADFLKDPDIIWAVTLEQDWVLDVACEQEEWGEGITTLKLLCEDPHILFSGVRTLSSLVMYSIASGDLTVFRDPACTIPMTWRNVLGYPSESGYDSVSGEETITIGCMDFNPDAYKVWRLRQVLAYHQKSASWSTRVESIGPLELILNEKGDSIDTRPAFWFRPDNRRQNLGSSDIVWAKRMKNQPAKHQVLIQSDKQIKSINASTNLRHQITALAEKRLDLHLFDENNDNLLRPEQRQGLVTQVDTIYESGDTSGPFVLSNRQDHIHQLRFVQNWYWDTRRHRLSICLEGVAPLLEVTDIAGNYRFTKVLFYRRSKR